MGRLEDFWETRAIKAETKTATQHQLILKLTAEIIKLKAELGDAQHLASQINSDWIPANQKLADRAKVAEAKLKDISLVLICRHNSMCIAKCGYCEIQVILEKDNAPDEGSNKTS